MRWNTELTVRNVSQPLSRLCFCFIMYTGEECWLFVRDVKVRQKESIAVEGSRNKKPANFLFVGRLYKDAYLPSNPQRFSLFFTKWVKWVPNCDVWTVLRNYVPDFNTIWYFEWTLNGIWYFETTECILLFFLGTSCSSLFWVGTECCSLFWVALNVVRYFE